MELDRRTYRFRLAYRPPYEWDAMLAFLNARAAPGVESVEDSRYRRTITVDGKNGSIEVSRLESGSALGLEVRFPDPRPLLFIVERVRGMFDLGADPAIIAGHLRSDPLLRRPLAKHPGIRTPGAWDGFELAVRAILGQQITVRAATTIAGRIASMFGSPVAGSGGLERLFPTPAQLADAEIERAGVTTSRAETIRSLARHVADGTIAFSSHIDLTALIDLNRDYIRSVQTSDVQRFKEILADDFLCSLPDGSLIDRERFLEQTARPVQISNLEAHDVNVRLMGDFAIVHARTTYRAPDGSAGSGGYTDVWTRRHGLWLAVSAHVTRN